MEWALLLLMGLQGYFTVFRLTPQSKTTGRSLTGVSGALKDYMARLAEGMDIIKGLNNRLSNLETEIKLRHHDASRIIEWLDKRDLAMKEFQETILKHINIEEREKRLDVQHSEIIRLGKDVSLLRAKK